MREEEEEEERTGLFASFLGVGNTSRRHWALSHRFIRNILSFPLPFPVRFSSFGDAPTEMLSSARVYPLRFGWSEGRLAPLVTLERRRERCNALGASGAPESR